MVIFKSFIFNKYPQINFGFSTKIGAAREYPFYFNVSFSVGDDERIVEENRRFFYTAIGLNSENVVTQKQVHSDKIRYIENGRDIRESDCIFTDKPNIGLALNIADCTPVFIYDKVKKIIAAVHAGWRGTEKRILFKTLLTLQETFKSSQEDLIVYIGPSISQKNYEVGEEVAKFFDRKYLIEKGDKYLLAVAQINYDELIDFGLKKINIQKSSLCTYEMRSLLHSYRRDANHSGRSMGIISLKGNGHG